jgi:hypothetical protein
MQNLLLLLRFPLAFLPLFCFSLIRFHLSSASHLHCVIQLMFPTLCHGKQGTLREIPLNLLTFLYVQQWSLRTQHVQVPNCPPPSLCYPLPAAFSSHSSRYPPPLVFLATIHAYLLISLLPCLNGFPTC